MTRLALKVKTGGCRKFSAFPDLPISISDCLEIALTTGLTHA